MDKEPTSHAYSVNPLNGQQYYHNTDAPGVSDSIPTQFRGTTADQPDMNILGKQQVLRRNFKFFTVLGFASTVMVSWEWLPIISIYALQDGGLPIVFWGLVAGCLGMGLVYVSLAEMASMCPTAGGQYHLVSELAPPSIQKELSYAVGWLTAMGWQVWVTGLCFVMASVIQGLIVLNNPKSYVYHAWHGTLLTIAVVIFALAINALLGLRLPAIQRVFIVLHVVGFLVIVITLWVTAPHGSVHDTLLHFTSTSGWDNLGLASMIGVVNPIGSLCGYDGCFHMAEEVQDASIVIPKALIWSFTLNALMALIMGITFIFSIGDLDSVLATPTGQPFIQVFYNATQSHAGATLLTSIIVVMLASTCISEVSPRWNIPLNAIYMTAVISSLISLIDIGSYTALNAINSLGVVSLLFSYTVTIGCLVLRRVRGPALPRRRWSLGTYGLAVNIASLCFIIPVLFFAFWPVSRPVTPAGFNWSSVMFVGVLLIALAHYVVFARHQY
ncbi:hypothetical protein M409DRAFT_62647 [Zasmidium cellare ATCC 36951]|uniref:Amino acid permease/ SLC12A domain-containing protein n=1 Tax=Zasmidium cellare ATCC 36951 TaxID=1080233 RepID=A0A6A6D3N4_ZASCE|nr:uncharacterized protein M409DRAFT_62647 [Zasmidium cellare ATCC 36951]KAF2173010.1 hypothetical protein M409DRAFT_62647 [Zasmidium cellare ATCC 36951]